MVQDPQVPRPLEGPDETAAHRVGIGPPGQERGGAVAGRTLSR